MLGNSVAAPLLQFVEEELALSPVLASKTLEAMITDLRQPGGAALSLDERRLHFDLSETLSARAATFTSAFERELRKRVLAEMQEREEGRPATPLGDGFGSLTLMDERLIESDIEISRAVLAIKNETEWEARELNAYVSSLCGLVQIVASANPLTAQNYGGALWDATQVVTLVPGLRSLIIRFGGKALGQQLKKAWAAATSRLESRGVEPTSYKTMAAGHTGPLYGRAAVPGFPAAEPAPTTGAPFTAPTAAPAATPGSGFLAPDIMAGVFGGPPPSPASSARAAPAAVEARLAPNAFGPSDAPLFPTIDLNAPPAATPPAQGRVERGIWGRAVPAAQAAPASLPLPTFEEPQIAYSLDQALAMLELDLQTLPVQSAAQAGAEPALPRLSAHRDALLAATTGVQQAMVDLMSRLFDRLLVDRGVHPAFRGFIAQLQPMVLRMALNNPRILENLDTPVWNLINTLSEIPASYPQRDDPRLGSLHRAVQAVMAELNRDGSGDPKRFTQAWTRLDEFLRRQLQEQVGAAAGHINTLERVEHRDRLQRELSLRLTEQLAMLRLSAILRRFITGHWSLVMAETIVRYGQDSEKAAQAFSVVDDLVWSLQSRGHPGALKRLMDMLPSLVQRLRTGMTLVGLPPADQQLIMNELMELHTSAVRASFKDGVDPKTVPVPHQLMTAQEIVARLEEDREGGTPSSVSAFGNSVIDVTSMETIPAELMEDKAPGHRKPEPIRIEDLPIGARVRLFLRGRWTPVQLLWRSHAGLHYLFAGESPGRTHSMTSRALDRLADELLLAPIEEQPLVQRALERVKKDLAAVR